MNFGNVSLQRTKRQLQPQAQVLETRNLMAVAGVTFQNGCLAVVAPMASGNVCDISIVGPNVHITLNGESEDFNAADVTFINYNGGTGGHDTFANHTGITSADWLFGDGNTVTGGTGMDFFLLFGNDNTVHSGGGFTVAFSHAGQFGYGVGNTYDPGVIVL